MRKHKYIKLTGDVLTAWAEMLEDMAKMVFVAIVPTLIFFDTKLKYGIIGTALMLGCAFLLVFFGLILRNIKHNNEKEK